MQKLKFLFIILSISIHNIFSADLEDSSSDLEKSISENKSDILNSLLKLEDQKILKHLFSNLEASNPAELFSYKDEGKNFMRKALDLKRWKVINHLWDVYYESKRKELFHRADDHLSCIDIIIQIYSENRSDLEENIKPNFLDYITALLINAYQSPNITPRIDINQDPKLGLFSDSGESLSDSEDYSSGSYTSDQSNDMNIKQNSHSKLKKLIAPIGIATSLVLSNKCTIISTAAIAGCIFLTYKLFLCMKDNKENKTDNSDIEELEKK